VKLSYRSDIDGLRALAVLAVVIYHFNKHWLPGGFLGVDIFFVISGFLITSIIVREIQTQQFSFKSFYLRRIKRIIPASLFFVALTLIVSYLVLLPHDFDRATKSAFASVIFASNFYFARNVDYFASSSEENPFLHTWSLSIEEQFYMFWPVILLVVYRSTRSIKIRPYLLILATIFSFAIATYWAVSPNTQKLAFYMLPARFGELLIGAMGVFILPKLQIEKRHSSICKELGLLLIFSSLGFIDESAIFPGLLALPVCIGTLLLIIGGHRTDAQSIITKILSCRPAVYVGAISYSLYLAHWPVLAFNRYLSQQYELTIQQGIICLALMWALAHFSWRWVETPFRRQQISFTKAFNLVLAVPSAIILAFCTYIILNKGVPSRFGLDQRSFTVASAELCHTHMRGTCFLGDSKNIKPYLLIGDSHAGHYLSYFDTLGKANNFGFDGRSVDGCAGVFSIVELSPRMARLEDCRELKKFANTHSNDYSHILIAERWDARVLADDNYVNQLDQYLQKMELANVNVILLAQIPKFNCDVNRSSLISGRISWAKKCDTELDIRYQQANDIVQSLATKYANAQFGNLNNLLCKDKCSPFLDGKLAYKDDDHLNMVGAQVLAEKTKFANVDWFN
jgi:peptidoglycan/LPS O-acetylase OafA/YrhL